MSEDRREKERARWRRNKRAARERARPVLVPLSPVCVANILAERDRRAAIARRLWGYHDIVSLGRDVSNGAGSFAADVWAARTLLELQLGVGMATPTRIARWLEANERTHGYASNSLRPMVYRALETIEALETTPDRGGTGETIWRPYSAGA